MSCARPSPRPLTGRCRGRARPRCRSASGHGRRSPGSQPPYPNLLGPRSRPSHSGYWEDSPKLLATHAMGKAIVVTARLTLQRTGRSAAPNSADRGRPNVSPRSAPSRSRSDLARRLSQLFRYVPFPFPNVGRIPHAMLCATVPLGES